MCACRYACVYVCMYVGMYVCMYVCLVLLCLVSQSRFPRGFLPLDYLASSFAAFSCSPTPLSCCSRLGSSCEFRPCVLLRISAASALSFFSLRLSPLIGSAQLLSLRFICLSCSCVAPELTYCFAVALDSCHTCVVAFCSRFHFLCRRSTSASGRPSCAAVPPPLCCVGGLLVCLAIPDFGFLPASHFFPRCPPTCSPPCCSARAGPGGLRPGPAQ